MPLPHLTLKQDIFLCAFNFSRLYNILFNSVIRICHISPIHSVSVTYQKLTYLLGTNWSTHGLAPENLIVCSGRYRISIQQELLELQFKAVIKHMVWLISKWFIQAAIGVTFRRSLKHIVSLLSLSSTRILNGLSSNSNVPKCVGNYDPVTILMHVYVHQFWEALGFYKCFHSEVMCYIA